MTKRKYEPSSFALIRICGSLLLLLIFASSLYAAYSAGQRSQSPNIAGMAKQVENWKMIYRAERVKNCIVMAYRDHITLDEFTAAFCLPNRANNSAFGKIREIVEKSNKHTHLFTDDETGRVFELTFVDGKLMGYHSGYGLGQAGNAVAALN